MSGIVNINKIRWFSSPIFKLKLTLYFKSFLLEDLEKAAQTIARKAIELAFDPDYLSPFALAARQNGIDVSGN